MNQRLHSLNFAMGRMRLWIVMCCWITALAMVVQILVWSLATFTDLRETVVEPEIAQPLIVQGSVDPDAPARPLVELPVSIDAMAEPIAMRSRLDYFMQDATSLAMTVGTMSCMILIPLVLVGVLAAASLPASTIDKSISAWIWTIIVAVLALPIHGVIELPWGEGALRSYPSMTDQIAAWHNGQMGDGMFFARFLCVPLLCSLGSFFVGWRFSRSVARMLPESERYIDPTIDQEASNLTATSTMNTGRAQGALGNLMGSGHPGPVGTIMPDDTLPNARGVSKGTAPRRLI